MEFRCFNMDHHITLITATLLDNRHIGNKIYD